MSPFFCRIDLDQETKALRQQLSFIAPLVPDILDNIN